MDNLLIIYFYRLIMNEEYSVLTKPDALNEGYIPSHVLSRATQIKELEFCVSPALRRMKPIHAWIYGEPGTGKTVTTKLILRKIQREANIESIYINCWDHNSYYSVLDKIVREFRILGAEKLNTSFKLERFERYVGEKYRVR